MSEKVRSRLWCVLLYPDDDSHLKALDIIRSSYSYVCILHNKDTWTEEDELNNPEHKFGDLKKPHFHIIIKFAQARWNTSISSELGITPNYLEPCRSFKNAGVYLVHSGIDDKHQYDISELEGSLVPDVVKALDPRSENERIILLLSLIDDMGWITYRKLLDVALQHDLYSDVRRMGFILSRVIDEHNSALAEIATDKRVDDFCKFTGDKDILPLE